MVQMMFAGSSRGATRPCPARGMKGPGWRARIVVLFMGLLLGLGLAGCGSPAPVKADQYFSLTPPTTLESGALATEGGAAARDRAPLPASLQVNDLAARGFLGGRQILFRTAEAPRETQRYEQRLWDEPVPRALSRHLASRLRDAGLFRFVLIPADRGRADYLLGGEVERFEHLPTAHPPRMAGTLSVTLIRASDGRPLLERRHDAEVTVTGPTPADMVSAASHLADQLAAAVVEDLRAWRAGGGHPPGQ